MNPILLNLPMIITTPRLIIRPFMPGDGVALNAAILESFEQLHTWMEWADHKPTVEETEIVVRRSYAEWIQRDTNMNMLLLDAKNNEVVGASGFNNINWAVPRFCTGYWVRTSYQGKGLITEAANALVRYAFTHLGAVRLEIRCDEDNVRSRNVAERLGFTYEVVLKNNERKPVSALLRNTVVYAPYDMHGLPDIAVEYTM